MISLSLPGEASEFACLGATVRKTIRDPWSGSLACFALCLWRSERAVSWERFIRLSTP